DPSALVCQAKFALTPEEIESLYEAAHPEPAPAAEGEQAADEGGAEKVEAAAELPAKLTLIGSRTYNAGPTFAIEGALAEDFDAAKLNAWAKAHVPKFVLIQDYGLSGTQIELNQLAERLKQVKWHQLTNEEQTVKVVLDLAKVNIDEFLAKGATPEGRTVRSFDKRAASSYLSKQFRDQIGRASCRERG